MQNIQRGGRRGRVPGRAPGNRAQGNRDTQQQDAAHGQPVVHNVPAPVLPASIQVLQPRNRSRQRPPEERSIIIYHVDNSAPAPIHSSRTQGRSIGDPMPQYDYGELKDKLAVFIPDAERLAKVGNPANPSESPEAAACRILNDCNKNKDALFALFHGRVDHKDADGLRQRLRQQIADALARAIELVSSGRRLTPWSISQLFTAIRGLTECKPFEGTPKEKSFDASVSELAGHLVKLLGHEATFNPHAQHPWKGKGFSQVLLGLEAIHEWGLAPLPDPRLLLQAMKSSLSARAPLGWEGWAYANCLKVFATLLPDASTGFSSAAGMEVLNLPVDNTIGELGSPHNTFFPLDCLQSLEAMLKLQDAGVDFGAKGSRVLGAIVNRVAELGSSGEWNPKLVKDVCRVLHEVAQRGLVSADDPTLNLASWTLLSLGTAHGQRAAAYKLRQLIDDPGSIGARRPQAASLLVPAEPSVPSDEPSQPQTEEEKPQAQKKTQTGKNAPPRKKGQPQKAAASQPERPQPKSPADVLADLRKFGTSDMCNRLTQPGAKEAAARADAAELMDWMVRITAEAPKAKKPVALALLRAELGERINLCGRREGLGSLCDFVEALVPLDHPGIAAELLGLVTAAVANYNGSLQGEWFNFRRLGALLGTLEQLGVPLGLVDSFLKALASKIKQGDLWNLDRSDAAWEVLSSGLDCQGVADLFNALLWSEGDRKLEGIKGRNAAVYKQFGPNWVSEALHDGTECIQITIPLGASQNVVAPFMCGYLDANEPQLVIIDADAKGLANVAHGRITWIQSQLDTLAGAPENMLKLKTFKKIVGELLYLVNPQLQDTFIDSRLKGTLRRNLMMPIFQVISAIRWRSPQEEGRAFMRSLAHNPDIVAPFCDLLANAVDAYGSSNEAAVNDAKWFLRQIEQYGGASTMAGVMERLETVIFRAEYGLQALKPVPDDEVPFLDSAKPDAKRGKTQAATQPQAGAGAPASIESLAASVLASSPVAKAEVSFLPGRDSPAIKAFCSQYLLQHRGSRAQGARALRELITGLLPLLYDSERRSTALEVLLSLKRPMDLVLQELVSEMAYHFNLQDLCAVVAAIQPMLSRGYGMSLLMLAAAVLNQDATLPWRLSDAQYDLLAGISKANFPDADHKKFLQALQRRTPSRQVTSPRAAAAPSRVAFPAKADKKQMVAYCTQFMVQHGGNTATSGARALRELMLGLVALLSSPGRRAVALETLLALEPTIRNRETVLYATISEVAAQFSAQDLCDLASAIQPALAAGGGYTLLQVIVSALDDQASEAIVLSQEQCNMLAKVASTVYDHGQVAMLLSILAKHRR